MEIKNTQQLKEASKTKSPFLTMEQGKNKLRIVSKIFGVKEHNIKIKDQPRMIACPEAMEQWEAEVADRTVNRSVKCPICESGDRKVKTQFMALAITDKGDVGVLKKGPTVFSTITELKEEGYELSKTFIVITRKGEGLETEYSVIPSKEEKELTDEEKNQILDFMKDFDLERRSKPMSYENIVRKLKGEDPIFTKEEQGPEIGGHAEDLPPVPEENY